MENKNIEKGKVCVTGGNGYVGSWLVMRLLQHGYYVNTTVRSNTELGFLKDLPSSAERLRIFEADLNQPDTFRAAIAGCIGVFLVAHQMPTDTTTTNSGETSTTSTLSILQACLDAKTVKRAIYTSSAVAAIFSGKSSATIDEESWSNLDLVHKSPPPVAAYAAAKTLTEKAALEFGEKHGLDVVTLLPTYIHGPFIGPRCPASVYTLVSMLLGNADSYKYLAGSIDVVHVDDVASAQIFLFESGDAKGRYICSAVGTTIDELYQLLCNRYPNYQIAPPDCSIGRTYEISSRKLLETGYKYKYGLEEMYDGAIESCKKLGLF
ncbi:protein BRI1-5 ENHANCED 1-like isoform X2 [Salvia splendens]|uniref:protein BRI1-5 ENHANCED 1-like isoform X2 n=1 Tax=Salvia splendens TaxID=180675 RepID=UPI001C2810CD|nr:protein BRI1-5 ENHANCED 1-like isoform X2 [Salvia splendens]